MPRRSPAGPRREILRDFDGEGVRTWRRYPDGSEYKVYADELNRPEKLYRPGAAGTPIATRDYVGGRVYSMTQENGTEIEHKYDALGRRIAKEFDRMAGPSKRIDDAYDGSSCIEELAQGTGLSSKTFVHGPGIDNPIYMDDGSAKSYYCSNSIGSITALADSTGAVVERYQYTPFGETSIFNVSGASNAANADITASTNDAGGFDNPFRFTARRKDFEEESELYDYRTRYYRPKTGRFICHDSIGDWGDDGNVGNGLAYCGNNPVNFVDPWGLDGAIWSPEDIAEGKAINDRLKDVNRRIDGVLDSGGPKPSITAELKRALAEKKALLRELGEYEYRMYRKYPEEGLAFDPVGQIGFTAIGAAAIRFGIPFLVRLLVRGVLRPAGSLLKKAIGRAKGLISGAWRGLTSWWRKGSECDAATGGKSYWEKFVVEIGHTTVSDSLFQDVLSKLTPLQRGYFLLKRPWLLFRHIFGFTALIKNWRSGGTSGIRDNGCLIPASAVTSLTVYWILDWFFDWYYGVPVKLVPRKGDK